MTINFKVDSQEDLGDEEDLGDVDEIYES